MAKAKPKKTKKGKSGGFFAKMFDILIALIIIGLIAGAVWYWFYYSEKHGSKIKDTIKGFYTDSDEKTAEPDKKVKKETEVSKIDENADEEEWDKEHEDYIEEDDMNDQFKNEIASNLTESETDNQSSGRSGFYSSINSWASKYKGLKVKNDTDPDKDRSTDNSHLVSAIWKHAASESGKKFSGYMTTEKILNSIDRIDPDEIKNGDLMLLKDGMYGMIVNHKSISSYELIYASGEQKKVVVIDLNTMKNYWLKPEIFKGYYRLEKNILN